MTIRGIEDELAKLRRAASAAPANSVLRQTITETGNSIAKGVSSLLSPRVYIHIADETQRDEAQALARRLAGARLGDYTILVPGVERVAKAPARALLRCFVDEECRQYGPPLLQIVGKQVAQPQLALDNFSRTYTPDGSIRALHFEIYFPPGPITLAASEKKSAY